MSVEAVKNDILWVKGLLNGVLAWILGFIIYMIPALVVAIKMGFELGPKSDDPSAVSEQISQTISEMYQNNLWLSLGFILVISLAILWRAKIVAKKAVNKTIYNGLLVAIFPLLFTMASIFSSGFEVTTVVEIILFIGAGYLGGYLNS